MFRSIGRAWCDEAGDIIFDVGSPMSDKGPFLRISADGRSHVSYSLPQEASGFGNIVSTITPSGVFYVLFENFKDYRLIEFKDDGPVQSVTSLELPSGVDLQHLAIADDGALFASGYRSSRDPLEKPRTGFAAVLSASGKFIRDLSSIAPQISLKAAQTGPMEGDAVAAEDGRFYVLETKRVLVINKSGEVERELTFAKPAKDANAVQVDYSKGLLSILFHSVTRNSQDHTADVRARVLVINAQTGETRGDFVFAPETSESMLCFDARNGFALMAVDGVMAAKDLVPLR